MSFLNTIQKILEKDPDFFSTHYQQVRLLAPWGYVYNPALLARLSAELVTFRGRTSSRVPR